MEGLETQQHPWCDRNGQGSGKECGDQPLQAKRDSVQQQWGWAATALPSAPLLVGQLHESPQGLPPGHMCAWRFFLQLLPTALGPHKSGLGGPHENGLGGGKVLPALCWAAKALPTLSLCHAAG